jgi:hypothetical protein
MFYLHIQYGMTLAVLDWSKSFFIVKFTFLLLRIGGKWRVLRGLVGGALACCKAGPSSNLGSAPHGGSAH